MLGQFLLQIGKAVDFLALDSRQHVVYLQEAVSRTAVYNLTNPKAFLQALFGWLDKSSGFRRFRETLFLVGRKNGKSTLLAALALYLLVADYEGAAEIYSVATKKDQARKTLTEAVNMIKQSPELRAVIKKRRNDVYFPATASKFEALASDSNTLDGLNSHAVIIDELHAIRDRNLYEVMKQSTSSRRQPLVIMITTSGTVRESVWWLYLVLGASVLVKAGMCLFYRVSARRLDSDTLKAAATDSACDCVASLAVILGMVLSSYTPWKADGYIGVAVALFILWQGACLLREAGSKLLGQAPDEALVKRVRGILLAGEGVLGVHDLKIYGYGKGVTFATAHAEMDARLPALTSHEVLDGLERKVLAETGVSLTLHLDPVVLGDEEAKELEARVRAAVEGLADGMNLHDFRLVRGVKTKVVFEVGIPFGSPVKDAELQNDIERAVRILGDYEPVVTVERE